MLLSIYKLCPSNIFEHMFLFGGNIFEVIHHLDEVFCDGQLQIFAPLTKVLHIILLIGGNMLLTISFATAMLPLLIIACWSR